MIYKAEVFDQLQYLYEETKFNDHQLHCVIRLENKLDKEILKKSIALLLKTVPILSSVYHHNHGKSYWETEKFETEDVLSIIRSESDFHNFTNSKTNESSGPQILICLYQADKDSLSVIMNHMVCDGADFKECLYLLSDLYSKLKKNPDDHSTILWDGKRSMKHITSQFTFWERWKAFLLQNSESNQKSVEKFPFSHEKDIAPYILTHQISEERFSVLYNYCKQNQVTINDAVLTAYYRVLAKMLNAEGKQLSIPVMIDMRKYLKEKNGNTLSNLSSTAITNMIVNTGEIFEETLVKVSKEMNEKKANYIGLNAFVKLAFLNRIMTKSQSCFITKKYLKNPFLCMTNIGIVEADKLVFDGSPIENVFVCGSIKYRPHFQLALSTYANKITFSCNLYGSKKDYNSILFFFDLLDKELPM